MEDEQKVNNRGERRGGGRGQEGGGRWEERGKIKGRGGGGDRGG